MYNEMQTWIFLWHCWKFYMFIYWSFLISAKIISYIDICISFLMNWFCILQNSDSYFLSPKMHFKDGFVSGEGMGDCLKQLKFKNVKKVEFGLEIPQVPVSLLRSCNLCSSKKALKTISNWLEPKFNQNS